MAINTKVTGAQQTRVALRKELANLARAPFVTVGIHQGAGDHPEGDITMAQLGAVHEFGTQDGHIPARPWLSPGVQSGNAEYLMMIQDGIEQGTDPALIMEQIGVVAVGKVQQYITELRTPPNAPSTIQQKGSSNPLIDTGAMRQSVTYKVSSAKPEEGMS